MDLIYQNDPRFQGAGQAQQRSQQDDDAWRQSFGQGIDTWLAGRRGYAQGLSKRYTDANTPGAEIAYRDDRRNAAFKASRTGTKGGSMDVARRMNARATYAQRLAQIMAGGQQIEQGQLGADEQSAMAMRTAGHQLTGSDTANAARLAGVQARGDLSSLYAQEGQLTAQRQGIQQQHADATAQAMSAWMPS